MRQSKHFGKLIGHGILLVLLILSGAVMPATALDINGHGADSFCGSLDKRAANVNIQLQKSQTAIRQNWQQQNEQLRLLTDEQHRSQTTLEAAVDAQRAANLNVMRQQAKTTVVRQAVDDYTAAQKQATTTRREAVQQANDTFTNAVSRLVADRQATQAGQAEALRITLNDALQTAAGQCSAGVDPTIVGSAFITAVHTSRQTFANQRSGDSAIAAQVRSLSQTRRQKTDAANQTYLTTMKSARQILQDSLDSTN